MFCCSALLYMMAVSWEHSQQNCLAVREAGFILARLRERNVPKCGEAFQFTTFVNVFGILVKLNYQLHGKVADLFSHKDIIKASLDKLNLGVVRVEGNNLVQLPCADVTFKEKETIQTQILDHILKPWNKFHRYFRSWTGQTMD